MFHTEFVGQFIGRIPKKFLHLFTCVIPVCIIIDRSVRAHSIAFHKLPALFPVLRTRISGVGPAEMLIQSCEIFRGKRRSVSAAQNSLLCLLLPRILHTSPHIVVKVFPENILHFIPAQFPVIIVLHHLISLIKHPIRKGSNLTTVLCFQHISYFFIIICRRRDLERIHRNFHTVLCIIYLFLPFSILIGISPE